MYISTSLKHSITLSSGQNNSIHFSILSVLIDNSLLSYIHTFKIIAYFSKKYNKILYFNPFFLFKWQFIV